MTTGSMRRTLVALATTAALLPAAPALAQTAPATPTRPALPNIEIDRTVIDHGGTHGLVVYAPVGDIGDRAQLWASTLPNRTPRLIREAVLEETEQDAVAVTGWDLQPGATTTYHVVVDAVRSAATTVRVRRTATIGIEQRTRGTWTFSGRIARADAGVQVTVARLDGRTRRVTGVASTRTTADGRYTVSTALPRGLAGYYALTEAAHGLDAGRSRLYGLLVGS